MATRMIRKICPVDRGRVLNGLNCLKTDDIMDCESCPYENDVFVAGPCRYYITREAIEYISYLEALLDAKGVTEYK